ncbi:MAG: ABC transporter permease [Lautropia sp.]
MSSSSLSAAVPAAGTSLWSTAIWPRIRRDRGALLALGFILLLASIAVFAPWIAPFDPVAQDIANSFSGPSREHWFGTDEYGRDVLSRIIHGARPALSVGILSVLFALVIGIPIGIVAGLRLGWFDRAVGWAVDIMLAFPSLLLALLIVTLLGSSLPMLILAIGISNVPLFIRLARGSTLVVRGLEYVQMARAFGASELRIVIRHVLPNIVGPIIVMSTLSVAGAVREEASLSFLGLGVRPPQPSWGNLIQDGISNLFDAPGLAVLPGLILTLAVLAFNVVGDVLRDVLDPNDMTRRKPAGRS